ncbi:MAG: hypothetical protein HY267_02905 [Deltaproteobacteria bacterium]|nr:hypothetical protein [Deltaproteobacteria bacterium]
MSALDVPGALRQRIREAERNRCGCPLLGGSHLPAELMEDHCIVQGKSEAKGVR